MVGKLELLLGWWDEPFKRADFSKGAREVEGISDMEEAFYLWYQGCFLGIYIYIYVSHEESFSRKDG